MQLSAVRTIRYRLRDIRFANAGGHKSDWRRNCDMSAAEVTAHCVFAARILASCGASLQQTVRVECAGGSRQVRSIARPSVYFLKLGDMCPSGWQCRCQCRGQA